jgi:hypothetical protein
MLYFQESKYCNMLLMTNRNLRNPYIIMHIAKQPMKNATTYNKVSNMISPKC